MVHGQQVYETLREFGQRYIGVQVRRMRHEFYEATRIKLVFLPARHVVSLLFQRDQTSICGRGIGKEQVQQCLVLLILLLKVIPV